MSAWWSILRNSGIVLAGNSVAKLLVLAATVIIGRALGPEQFGWYSLVLTYVMFVAILPELGMDAIVTREMARQPQLAAQLLGAAVSLRLIMILIVTVVALWVFPLLGYRPDLQPVVVVALAFVLAFSLGALVETHFRARLAMGIPAVAKVVAKAVLLLVVLAVLRRVPDEARLMAAVGATVLPDLLAVGMMFLLVWRQINPELEFGWQVWQPILRESWPLALTAVSVMVYLRVDVFMLSRTSEPQAVGNYAAAYNLVEMWGGIAMAFGISLLPILSKSATDQSAAGFWGTYRQSSTGLMLLLVPVSFLTTLYASEIIEIIYGRQYSGAAPALSLLIWAQVFAAISVLYTNALTAHQRQRWILVLAFASAVVNVLLNLVLIPALGIVGASIATIFAYGSGTLILLLFQSTRCYIAPFINACVVPLAASLVGALTVWFFGLKLIWALMVFSLVYLCVSFVFLRHLGMRVRALNP